MPKNCKNLCVFTIFERWTILKVQKHDVFFTSFGIVSRPMKGNEATEKPK